MINLFSKKNKARVLYVLIAFGVSLIFGCSKDKKSIIKSSWRVESIKMHTDSALISPSNTYILSFESSRKYSIKLDVNTCSGKVRFAGKSKVDFGNAGCTYICCDSYFAEKTIELLAHINKYELNDSFLVLNGSDGKVINLKKI